MNRRQLLSGMACGVLAGGTVLARAQDAVARPTDWLNKWLPRLPEIAKVQATVKAQNGQLAREVLHGTPWHPGITFLVLRSNESDALASFRRVSELLKKSGVEQLAVGWSDDKQVWTQFVLADSADVQRIVEGNVRACIGVESRDTAPRAA